MPRIKSINKLLRVGMSKVTRGRKYVLNKSHRWAKAELSAGQRGKLITKGRDYRMARAKLHTGMQDLANNPYRSIAERGSLAGRLAGQQTQIRSKRKYLERMQKWFGIDLDIQGKKGLYYKLPKKQLKLRRVR